jgi:hypothetical protein
MLVTSKTPGADGAPASSASGNASASSDSATEASGKNATQPASTSSSAPSSCKDLPTPEGHTCQQQKDWGKCGADFIKTNGYCKATCGACGGSSSNGGDKKVQAFSGQSGRKMLQREQ